ncbi:MAG: hypothetical protein L0H03_17705, partial [Rhodococcus sp. (in: high G+C Gram-positive bacteria)]|nr:hypothetical protein [Rhodococcus sp. (in: high G+C Gram-positive bacteria)]
MAPTIPAAEATQSGADEYIRTQCRTASMSKGPGAVKFCDAQYYVYATGQRRHVVTATPIKVGTVWSLRLGTKNKSVSNGRITTKSAKLTVTDSWSSPLTAKSAIYGT